MHCYIEHRQRIPLWQFLLHLLNRDTKEKYIQWSKEYELEFRIKDTIGVAELWGSVKNKNDMTYEKLGRAMRYYYGKSIIEKVRSPSPTVLFCENERPSSKSLEKNTYTLSEKIKKNKTNHEKI